MYVSVLRSEHSVVSGFTVIILITVFLMVKVPDMCRLIMSVKCPVTISCCFSPRVVTVDIMGLFLLCILIKFYVLCLRIRIERLLEIVFFKITLQSLNYLAF
jgi:hypothetical protein